MQPEERHPFDAFAAGHPVGTKLRGRVASVHPYGAFCELAEGVCGLLLVVDFADGSRRRSYPDDYPRVGDSVDVWVERIVADGRKIRLTQRPPGAVPLGHLVEETFAVAATGEPVRLRRTPDGRPVCPVCDTVWPSGAESAWRVTGDRTSAGVLTVVPSWGICPCCATQFGLDDDYDPSAAETLQSAWAALRDRL